MESPTQANPNNVQRQLAIFDVVRRARGTSLPQIKEMLTKAFAERGLSRQPGAWLDAVASEAAYGKPYLIDLPAAVAANSIAAAPDPEVESELRKRGILRSENSTRSQHLTPAATKTTDEGEESGHPIAPVAESRNKRDAAHPGRASGASTAPAGRLIASALLIALAAAAVGVVLRQRRGRPTSPSLTVGACR
ncbi:hypothetical protein [Arthrobacter sp. efr-133-R2A-63]|uniref:hypothetical protein n=1 Tax=Arthrobacter sp. efr-133-R2A-63 TaxID=3040278 RepID=UPI00254F6538|nr:hypothetical protein [Arthrobacter sp. efr-133-R2A-63]